MTEVESPPVPVNTKGGVPTRPSIIDQVKRFVTRTPELPTADLGDYETDARTMEPSVIKTCRQLKPDFEKGKYSLIVVDDISGRLPGLAIKGVADFISNVNHKQKPGIVFIQASSGIHHWEVVNQFNQRILPHLDIVKRKRVLIVTDYINTGSSIEMISAPLTKNGIRFDVVALEISPFAQNKGNYQKIRKSAIRILSGPSETVGTKIYNRPDLSGLGKNRYGTPKVMPSSRDSVIAARRDIKRLVARTLNAIYAG